MTTEDILYNVMITIGKSYNQLRALDEFDSANAKLVMAGVLAEMGLMLDLFGPKADEVPKKRGLLGKAVDSIRL